MKEQLKGLLDQAQINLSEAQIEQQPDFPLVHDMNKYMARATSAIAPKRSPPQIEAAADSLRQSALGAPVAKRMRT